jgi:hypothetical protein
MMMIRRAKHRVIVLSFARRQPGLLYRLDLRRNDDRGVAVMLTLMAFDEVCGGGSLP